MSRSECEGELRERIGPEFSRGLENWGRGRVRRWVLRRGKEFASPWIWWGDVTRSRKESYGGGPHEGVDFALAEMEPGGRVEAGLEGMPVQAFLAGKVVWSFADLVGDTVIVATDERIGDHRLIVQYSHIEGENASPGDRVAAGGGIGRIKLSNNPKSITAAHLHVSTAMLSEDLLALPSSEVDFTNWLHWEREGSLLYLDPLELLEPGVRDRLFLVGAAAQSPLTSLIGSGPTKEDRLILRRVLARSFPGVQVVSRLPEGEAAGETADRDLVVWMEGRRWRIVAGRALKLPAGPVPEGEGFEDLIGAIRGVEAANWFVS